MEIISKLPVELGEEIISYLAVSDLGNLALTCKPLYNYLNPQLSDYMKYLIIADSDTLELLRSRRTEAHRFITDEITDRPNNQNDRWNGILDLDRFIECIDACPMLAKYPQHAIIDCRKLPDENSPTPMAVQRLRNAFLTERTEIDTPTDCDWKDICRSTATGLMMLSNVQSIIFVGWQGAILENGTESKQ